MSKKIGIIGAGTWGIVLARMLVNLNNDVSVWSALPDEVDLLNKTRIHPKLPNMKIPEKLVFTNDKSIICQNKDILLFAVPSVYIRTTANELRDYIPNDQLIVNVAKGIEENSLLSMSKVICDELQKDGTHKKISSVVLSGPTHAEEVAQDLPTTIVSASEDLRAARLVQSVFMSSNMRVYTNPDPSGVEFCGALKNIIALAAGISDGLGFGDNAKAAIITRGMAEMVRLGSTLHCQKDTFYGLAGIGDMIVTATSRNSRNHNAGYLIGQGELPKEAIKHIGMVVEGVNVLPAALNIATKSGIEAPIVTAVDQIINHKKSPTDIAELLMERKKKSEID